MSNFSGRLGLAIVLAGLPLSGHTAYAQTLPMTYWTPNWPIGFGGQPAASEGSNTYSNFPSFDGSTGSRGGSSYARYNFSNGWFVGSESAVRGLGISGINQDGGFSNISSLTYQGVKFGYNLQGVGGLPLTVYAGVGTTKYSTGLGSPFAPFDTVSTTLPVYSAHAGVEFQPTSNTSISLGVGYTQQSGQIDSNVNSPLMPGLSPFAFGVRR